MRIYTYANAKTHALGTLCAHRQNFPGWCVLCVLFVLAQMMYFMPSASFTSLGDTATLFQSLSHVPPVPPGDVMTRDRWHKKIHLASFLVFPSASFWSPYILNLNIYGPYMHQTITIIAHFMGRSLFRCCGPIIFPLMQNNATRTIITLYSPCTLLNIIVLCCIIFCMCHEVSGSGRSGILAIYISLIKWSLLNLKSQIEV